MGLATVTQSVSQDEEHGDLSQPLLLDVSDEGKAEGANSKSPRQGVGQAGAVLNLVKCVLGAGLLSVPRAFSLLGGALGTLAFLLVAWLTVFTVEYGLITPSIAPAGTGGGESLALASFAATVSYWVGPRAERLLCVMVLFGLLGYSATFLDIIADILVGDENNPGLLTGGVAVLCSCNVFKPQERHKNTPLSLLLTAPAAGHSSHSTAAAFSSNSQLYSSSGAGFPSVAAPLVGAGLIEEGFIDVHAPVWVSYLVDRSLVLLVVVALFLLPLQLQRSMNNLSAVNAVGLAALAAFLASLLWLAGMALWHGTAHPLPLLPDEEALGSTPATQVLAVFSVLSVLLTANGCHPNMHPLMTIVEPFSRQRVRRILLITMCITTAYYWLSSVASYLVFGQDIREDILTNLSPVTLEPLVGRWAALMLAWSLRAGYMVSIMGSAILTMFPLRQAATDLLLGAATALPAKTAAADSSRDRQEGQGSDSLMPASRAGSIQARHSSNHGGGVSGSEGVHARHHATHAGDLHTGTGVACSRTGSPRPSCEHEPRGAAVHGEGSQEEAVVVVKASDAHHHPSLLSSSEAVSLTGAGIDTAVVVYAAGTVGATGTSGDGGGVDAEQVKLEEALRERQQRADRLHVPLTLGLMAVAYVLAVTVPSIWVVICLVGSVSATFMCFLMPAMVGLRAMYAHRRLGRLARVGVRGTLYVTMLLGSLIFVNGFITLYLLHQAQQSSTEEHAA